MSLRGLEQARHQADTLGNHVLGLELAAAACHSADVEERFHLRALGRWIQRRSAVARARAAELALPAGWLEAGEPSAAATQHPSTQAAFSMARACRRVR